MVYLNGQFVDDDKAVISILDRGFLFADGVYEVIAVYNRAPFRLLAHLSRLQHNLDALAMGNPLALSEWQEIIKRLILEYHDKTLSIYIQITRGADNIRTHLISKPLSPTVFVQAKSLNLPTLTTLQSSHHYAITKTDIRWQRCDIKSIALVANILLLKEAEQQAAEEVLLIRNGVITEGAKSNIFIVKNGTVYTHPANSYILNGITRDAVIQSILAQQIPFLEKAFPAENIYEADEIWMSSSTQEIVPITYVNNQAIGNGQAGQLWYKVYQQFQQIKINECQT